MRKVNITYHMERGSEIAESCITLPMEDAVAADILKHGEDSAHLSMMQNGEVYRLLRSLAAIQGYEYIGACAPREVL